ncbi:MAG TPA: hypothetical protein VK753_01915, partial [Xanthomonadaceae bacterium]|nr:hypothetical protein [Xanthomonadaceae bacterium]
MDDRTLANVHDSCAKWRRSAGYNCGIVNPSFDATAATRNATDSATLLRVEFSGLVDAALRFAFADDCDRATRVRCTWLAGPRTPECWHLGDRYRALVLEPSETDGDVADAARRAYSELISRVRGSSHPYLLRIWNYLGAINDGDGDGERYRRFCVGRAAAVDAAFND